MKPSDWISIGALIVAAVSIVVGAVIAPRLAATLQAKAWLQDRRAGAYADALHVLNERLQELENESLGWPTGEPHTEGQINEMAARLQLYGTEPVAPRVLDEPAGSAVFGAAARRGG